MTTWGMTRRDFGLSSLAASLAGLAVATPGLAMAQSIIADRSDPLWFVNPELREAVRRMHDNAPPPEPWSPAKLAAIRPNSKKFARPRLPNVPVQQLSIPVGHDAPDVTIYVINAKPDAARPGILHTHGGGYIAGRAADAVGDLQELALALDCAIVTVEYRLAPETTYAGSIEDNYAGLKWLHAHAADVGVDRRRLCVMGESAGGGHAALLAITARDRGEVPLAFQLLMYPMLDDRTASTRAVPPPIGTLLWTADDNVFGWRSFLGQQPGGPSVPFQAVPARNPSLKGLPPAFIAVGSIDLFVDEDIEYARRLIAAGTPTELIVVPGAYHGFDVFVPDAPLVKSFKQLRMAAFRRALFP